MTEQLSREIFELVKNRLTIMFNDPEDNSFKNFCLGGEFCYDHSFDYPEWSCYAEAGLTKGVFIFDDEFGDDWVVKIPLAQKQRIPWCRREVEIYHEAVKQNLDMFFAPAYFIGNLFDRDIFIMQRADCNEQDVSDDMWGKLESEGLDAEELEEKFSSCYDEDSTELVDDLFEYYYEIFDLKRLRKFMEDEGINDVHAGNVGYINDRLVMVDYSGY